MGNLSPGAEQVGGVQVGRERITCTAAALMTHIATGGPVTDEEAKELGIRIYGKPGAEGLCPLTGFAAHCACTGMVGVDLDPEGRISDVTPLPDQPSMVNTCLASAGTAVVEQFQSLE